MELIFYVPQNILNEKEKGTVFISKKEDSTDYEGGLIDEGNTYMGNLESADPVVWEESRACTTSVCGLALTQLSAQLISTDCQ